MKSRRVLTTTALMAALIAGCAVEPGPKEQPPSEPHTIQGLLQAAAKTNDASLRREYQLEAARRLQSQGDHASSRGLLDSIASSQLDSGRTALYQWLRAREILADGDEERARRLSAGIDSKLIQRLPRAERAEALDNLARLHRLGEAPLKAAQVLIAGYDILEESDWTEHNNRIWEALRSAPIEQLRDVSTRATDWHTQAWLELALTLHSTDRFAIEARAKAIRNWEANWTNHPASGMLPAELDMLKQLPNQRPDRVALALPLSGSLAGPGRAVREGFLAAFYNQMSNAEQEDLALTLHDTNAGGFSRVYAELLETETDLVIGPLRKQSLARLKNHTRMPIPVLALNYTSDINLMPQRLYQFGLASEDEVRQVAARLHADQHRSVLVFAPASDWGTRMAETLESAFETGRSARVLRSISYDEQQNFNRLVASAFAIDQSRQRARELMRITGTTMHHEPRRRQDIDAIVLLASPANARQFNPLFAFYYGGNLPVYGTSLLYQGVPDPDGDSDLDGIAFTDIPWVLDPEQTLRPRLNRLFPSLGERYDRLFALGVDSYHLANRLPVFREIAGYRIRGRTGMLEMDSNGVIRRHQDWARFKKGHPVRLEQTEQSSH